MRGSWWKLGRRRRARKRAEDDNGECKDGGSVTQTTAPRLSILLLLDPFPHSAQFLHYFWPIRRNSLLLYAILGPFDGNVCSPCGFRPLLARKLHDRALRCRISREDSYNLPWAEITLILISLILYSLPLLCEQWQRCHVY